MMHGHEKSSSAIVAVKPTNKVEHIVAEQSATERTAAEPVEPRAEAEGNGRPAPHAPGTVPGTRAPGAACIRRTLFAVDTRGGNRMRESCTYGSVRGVRGNSHPYRAEGASQSWRDQPVQVRPG